MALGRCELHFEATGESCAITDASGKPRSHPAWIGNPAWDIYSPNKIIDCAGHRPYIKRWENRRIIFNEDYRPRAGKLYLLPHEKYEGEGFIVVNPHIKDNASPNKRWEWANWAALVEALPYPVIQVGQSGDRILPNVTFVETGTFRHAAGVVAKARMVICHEGGLHHIAASMGKPAVVIFGAFANPLVTGYKTHLNISVDTEEGFCGRFDACGHCAEAMDKITPEIVLKAFYELDGRI